MSEQRDRGRAAFERKAWGEAYAHLSAADKDTEVPPEDLERLAIAASLLGRDAECADLWARAHHEFVRQGDSPRGARCAISLAFTLRASWPTRTECRLVCARAATRRRRAGQLRGTRLPAARLGDERHRRGEV